ncbi:MAG: hypothetical protein Q8R00_02800, partial [Candidatus Nanoarchaeia archaeon]|nr:hypothetical protein [Candidatus Nanoarchaeia archaeon]
TKQTTNKTLVVALLFFLAAFYVANVNISGNYAYRQSYLACAPGDVNRDGAVATDRDFERVMRIIDGDYAFNECADINKDGLVNQRDIDELYRLRLEVIKVGYP